jgi:BON domain
MNKISVSLMFASVLGSAAIAQQTPTDTKILHDASAVLANEQAFQGLQIVPTVSHGTVTLTGTVSSQGDKVLAGMEVGQVRGVRTVLNNLEVGGAPSPNPPGPDASQDQALAGEVSAIFDDPQIPAGTTLFVRLGDAITTKTAKASDQFRGTVPSDLYVNGTLVLPAGTTVIGRVVSAKPLGRWVGQAELSLELMTIQLPTPDGKGRSVDIATEPLESAGKGSNAGAVAGALASGPSGLGGITPGSQIELRAGAVLQFNTAAPVTIPAVH